MIKAKASVLAVILWILVILTMLAVSIGHRVSMSLRLSSYQKDRLKAFYLAKAGLNTAIKEINNDPFLVYDGLTDNWVDNEAAFRKIYFDDNPDEFVTVSYDTLDSNNELRINYGVIDEESKININTVSKELLMALLEKCGIDTAQEIVNNILIWRGEIPDENKVYENAGYAAKAGKFTNIEELILVKGVSALDCQKLKGLVTNYGEGFININTASVEVVAIFARGIAKELSIGENFADGVVEKLIDLRNNNIQFKAKSEINIALTGDEETNIFNKLMDKIVVQSNIFLIESTGNVRKIKSKLMVVYNRRDKSNLYWHEN